MGANSSFSFVKEEDSFVAVFFKQRLEKILGLPKLFRELAQFRVKSESSFWEESKNFLNLDIEYNRIPFEQIVKNNRPLIIVTNHPRGLVDGICVANLIIEKLKRNDFKFIANSIIGKIFPEIEQYNLPVDNMRLNKKTNRSLENGVTLARAIEHLKAGHLIALHPAGEVAGIRFLQDKKLVIIADGEWKETFVKIAKKTNAVFLPVHISGHNSCSYLVAGFFGVIFKRLLNFREFLKTKDIRVTLTCGDLIPIEFFHNISDDKKIAKQLRKAVVDLAQLNDK